VSQPFRELGGRRIWAWKYHKRLENIADNASGQDSVEGCSTSLPDKNAGKARVFTDSCTEPIFLTPDQRR
jgi:hypothetical protein